MADSIRSFTIGELVLDTSIQLPIIAEVKEDYHESQHKFKKGDLLWLIQLVEEDDKSMTSVEGSRWDAPDIVFSLKMTSKMKISRKPYSSVQEHIAFGPVLDASGLANLAEPSKPVFGLAAEGMDGVLRIADESGRVVVHEKVHITGFLAKGAKNSLIIPGDYQGLFTKSTMGTKKAAKPCPLTDVLRQLPMEVTFSGHASTNKRAQTSPDENTLLNESPITILALCRYTATHFSLHNSNPFQPPFQATWLYPDYCKLPIRPTSPIPLHSWAIDNVAKPNHTVHILSEEQFEEMNDRLKQSPPPVPAHSPSRSSTTPFKLASLDREPIYEVAPPDARRPVSLMPSSNGKPVSGSTVYDVPQRRSIKRGRRNFGRSASDLCLNDLSYRYVNLGMVNPQPGIKSDGYMRMEPVKPTNGSVPVLPPRSYKTSPDKAPDSAVDEKAGTGTKPTTKWKPTPAPRFSGTNKASTFPRQSGQPSTPQRPILQRHVTDSVIDQLDDDELDYGHDYTLITDMQGNERAKREESGNKTKVGQWSLKKLPGGKHSGHSEVDYGGHYAEAYEHSPQNWADDTDERGYLKPRKDL